MDEGLDFSKAIEKIQQMLSDNDGQNQIQNILSMFTSDSDNASSEEHCESTALPVLQSPSPSFTPSDMDLLFKIRNIMSAINSQQNSAQASFLTALKPFLKKERRGKVEQAVKIMNTAKALRAFKDIDKGGV